MTSSTASAPSYRDSSPDEGHEALRAPLAAAIDELAETVAQLGEARAGVDDAYFLTDALFQMIGELMGALGHLSVQIAELAAARDCPQPELNP